MSLSALAVPRVAGPEPAERCQVEIVVPVFNERDALARSIRRLHRYLASSFPFAWQIVIADNASTDDTLAIARRVASELIGATADEGWFFDTELLIAAQRRGYRIHEVPVDWVEDPDSRVHIVATALADLRGIARLARAHRRPLDARAAAHRRAAPRSLTDS